MCGIVGYIGDGQAAEIVLKSLQSLSRGYDSAGIATVNDGKLHLRRSVGKLNNSRSSKEPSSQVT